MKKFDDLQKELMKDAKYKKAYNALDEEYAFMKIMISARANAGLTQSQLARKMNTTQSAIARIEGGKSLPSTRTLQKLAVATGTKLKISFEPTAKRGR